MKKKSRDSPAALAAPGGEPPSAPVGIKDIARALGVSIGTVDRALHGRPGIHPRTRAEVLEMARLLGYRPNLVARLLKSKKQLHISVHLPDEIGYFFDPLREGIREAARPFQGPIQIQFRSHPRLSEGELELLHEALASRVSGIILAPGHPGELKPFIDDAARIGIPVVCVATDAPDTGRLSVVSSDPFICGAMAAELLCRFGSRQGEFAVVTGDLSTTDHAEKVSGFQATLREMACSARLGPVLEAHDDEREAYRQLSDVLRRSRSLSGVYVSTANCLPVLQALDDAGRLNGVAVVTTDFFPALVPWFQAGKVLATIHQRPFAQGREAFRLLHQFLVEGVRPPSKVRIAPHLVLKSNLDLFLGNTDSEIRMG